MRYFFTFLGLMIVWRSFSWLRKDRRQKHKRLKQLPDAGTIGILTVEAGSKHLQPGSMLPVPYEGVLGFLRTCDVVVPVDEVASMHLDFSFVDGKGLFIYPRRGCDAAVDGIPLTSRRDSDQYPMQHGSVLQVGQAVLRLGVFAGLNVQETPYAAYATTAEAQKAPDLPPEPPDFGDPSQPMPPNQPQSGYSASPYDPVNPAMPPYGPSPFVPPHQQSAPWQGGDDDAP